MSSLPPTPDSVSEQEQEKCEAVVISLGASVCASVLARVYPARVYMREHFDFTGYFDDLSDLSELSGQLFLEAEGHRILIQKEYLTDKVNIESNCDKSQLHPADPYSDSQLRIF